MEEKKVLRFVTDEGKVFEIDRQPVEQLLLEQVVSKTEEFNETMGFMMGMLEPIIKMKLGDIMKDKPKEIETIEWLGYHAVMEGLNHFPEEGLPIPELREVEANGE